MSNLFSKMALIFILALSTLQASFAQTTAGAPWFGTWSTSPSSLPTSQYASMVGPTQLTFKQQTIRQFVFTSVGGTSARLHFSNQYGTTPLTISDVHIGQANPSTGAIIAGTDNVVKFVGATSITIPAGGAAVSDEVVVAVPARSYMAISLYLPSTTAPTTLTSHYFGFQYQQFGSGDISGQTLLSNPGGFYPTSYFFLTQLDVRNTSASGTIVQLGASVTDGMNSTIAANHRWGNYLAQRLQNAGINVGVFDQGIPGSNMLSDNEPLYGDGAINRFSRDVLNTAGVRWIVYSEYNDVLQSGFTNLKNGLLQMISIAHAQQINFVCATTTPFSAPGQANNPSEAIRQQYNSFVRTAGNGCDAVIDEDAATRNPSEPSTYLPAYNSGDNVHPNDAGYQAIANAFPISIFSQSTPLAPANPTTQCGVLPSGKNLNTGGVITSCDGRFTLSLQSGGTLILKQGGTTLWSATTGGVQGRLLPNGNFVFADSAGKPTWATNTDRGSSSVLAVQNDGNVVLYFGSTPVWTTGTCCH